MLGGVRRAASNGRPYPIHLVFCNARISWTARFYRFLAADKSNAPPLIQMHAVNVVVHISNADIVVGKPNADDKLSAVVVRGYHLIVFGIHFADLPSQITT